MLGLRLLGCRPSRVLGTGIESGSRGRYEPRAALGRLRRLAGACSLAGCWWSRGGSGAVSLDSALLTACLRSSASSAGCTGWAVGPRLRSALFLPRHHLFRPSFGGLRPTLVGLRPPLGGQRLGGPRPSSPELVDPFMQWRVGLRSSPPGPVGDLAFCSLMPICPVAGSGSGLARPGGGGAHRGWHVFARLSSRLHPSARDGVPDRVARAM